MENSVWLSVCWITFYFLHSWLAADRTKSFGVSLLGGVRYYRLFYTSFSTVALLAICLFLLLAESQYFFVSARPFKVVSFILTAYGVIILKRSFKDISIGGFLGLREDSAGGLISDGLHGYVRHPIYSGTILIFIGAFFFFPTDLMLTSVLWLVAYLPIGIYLEEKKLIKLFGDSYRAYKKEVKWAVIPKIL